MPYPVYTVPDGDTLPILFDTFDVTNGASITMTGLAVTDIEIYKDGGATQRASDNGYTLLDTDGIDFDGITGFHGFSIDLSDNSNSGFYTVGAWFHVVVSAITVNTQTVNFIAAAFRIVASESVAGVPEVDVTHISSDSTAADNLELQYDTTGLSGDTFPSTQSQLAGIANVGSAVARTAASYVLTTGTQSSGTISSVAALDGTNHEHTDATGSLDLYYQFNIGSGIPSSVTMTGYLNGNNDDLEVLGRDWVADAWVRIGTLSGKNQSTCSWTW